MKYLRIGNSNVQVCAIVAISVMLCLGSVSGAGAQDCDCSNLVPSKYSWTVRINEGQQETLHVSAKLAANYALSCAPKLGGGKGGGCMGTVHLEAVGASFRAVKLDETEVEIFSGHHGVFADASDTVAAGRCSRDGTERKSVAYFAFLDKPDFEYTHIVGEASLSLSVTCEDSTVGGIATPDLVLDTRIRKMLVRSSSDLDGDGSPGFLEELELTSDSIWDFDGDGVPDGPDELPADPSCSTGC